MYPLLGHSIPYHLRVPTPGHSMWPCKGFPRNSEYSGIVLLILVKINGFIIPIYTYIKGINCIAYNIVIVQYYNIIIIWYPLLNDLQFSAKDVMSIIIEIKCACSLNVEHSSLKLGKAQAYLILNFKFFRSFIVNKLSGEGLLYLALGKPLPSAQLHNQVCTIPWY